MLRRCSIWSLTIKIPFDRLLIAQTRCEGMRMVTHDRLFRDYLPDTILVRAG